MDPYIIRTVSHSCHYSQGTYPPKYSPQARLSNKLRTSGITTLTTSFICYRATSYPLDTYFYMSNILYTHLAYLYYKSWDYIAMFLSEEFSKISLFFLSERLVSKLNENNTRLGIFSLFLLEGFSKHTTVILITSSNKVSACWRQSA